MPIDPIASIVKKGVLAVQNYALLAGKAIGNIFQRPHYFADLIVQADSIGIGSVPIVILTGFFTGGVLALQSASSLAQFGATAITGELVSLSMIKELGPVLTSLMVSGRNASGMASELGSMMVTEQIDAMRALGALSLFLFPLVGHFLHLSDHAYGLWAGLAVDNTAEATAAGAVYSDAAGKPGDPAKTRSNAMICF